MADSLKQGAKEVRPLIERAKIPLIASGAALAGAAGALAISRSGGRPKILGVSIPKGLPGPKLAEIKPDPKKLSQALIDAAERADRFGQDLSRVAGSLKEVGESTEKVAK